MRYVKGLRADDEGGEGEVKLPKEFYDENGVFQADLLGDWMYDLAQVWAKIKKDPVVAHGIANGMIRDIDCTVGYKPTMSFEERKAEAEQFGNRMAEIVGLDKEIEEAMK